MNPFRAAIARTYDIIGAFRTFLLAVLMAAAFFSASHTDLYAQATIRVPADQPTIQAGINAAQNGDTVLVSPGTYYENIDFKGKAITVISANGPTQTIIDGGSNGPVVLFHTNESRNSIIEGFTIQNGGKLLYPFDNTKTGGIYVDNGHGVAVRDSRSNRGAYGQVVGWELGPGN